jgi:soluble lytic murein transglycosylase
VKTRVGPGRPGVKDSTLFLISSTAVAGWIKNVFVKRCRPAFLVALLAVSVLAFLLWREERREKRFVPQIKAAAARYGVDPFLIKAIVWRESRFYPEQRGGKGEVGLMQIQEIAAQEWADAEHVGTFQHQHCFDPGTNVFAGTFYLGKLLKRYRQADDAVPFALADYNAGRGNVLKWNNGAAATNSAVFVAQIGFPGTRSYVRSVMRRRALYRWLAKVGWE